LHRLNTRVFTETEVLTALLMLIDQSVFFINKGVYYLDWFYQKKASQQWGAFDFLLKSKGLINFNLHS